MGVMIYDNIFSAAYSGYKKYDHHTNPYFSAVLFITICQIMVLSLIIAFLKFKSIITINNTNYNNNLNRFFVIIIMAIWAGLNFLYFSRKRVSIILEKYNGKKAFEKRMWEIVAVLSAAIPIFLLPVLLKK
jgi:hypothetical protein